MLRSVSGVKDSIQGCLNDSQDYSVNYINKAIQYITDNSSSRSIELTISELNRAIEGIEQRKSNFLEYSDIAEYTVWKQKLDDGYEQEKRDAENKDTSGLSFYDSQKSEVSRPDTSEAAYIEEQRKYKKEQEELNKIDLESLKKQVALLGEIKKEKLKIEKEEKIIVQGFRKNDNFFRVQDQLLSDLPYSIQSKINALPYKDYNASMSVTKAKRTQEYNTHAAVRLHVLLYDYLLRLGRKSQLNNKQKGDYNAIISILITEGFITQQNNKAYRNDAAYSQLRTYYPFSFAYQLLINDLRKIEASNVKDLIAQINSIDKQQSWSEQEKLLSLEQTLLNQYYKLRQEQGSFESSPLADELERFLKYHSGLNLVQKYGIDIPHSVKEGMETPIIDKLSKRPKKVALVDIDNTILFSDGTINRKLIEKLKSEYDEVVLFTQRNRYLHSTNLKHKLITHPDGIIFFTDLVDELKKEGLAVRVSVSPLKGAQSPSPFTYYDEVLKPYDEVLKAGAKSNSPDDTNWITGHVTGEVTAEKDMTPLGKVGQYEQVSNYLQTENAGRGVEFSVFDDSIDNLAEIGAALSAGKKDMEVTVSISKVPNKMPSFYYVNGQNNDDTKCYRLNDNDLQHFVTMKKKDNSEIGPKIPDRYFKFEQSDSKVKQTERKDDYQNLEAALEKYVAHRHYERNIHNSRYHSFFGRLSGMSSEQKIGAATKLIWAKKIEAGEIVHDGKGKKITSVTFDNDDIVALRNDRLGKLVERYETQLPKAFIAAENERYRNLSRRTW